MISKGCLVGNVSRCRSGLDSAEPATEYPTRSGIDISLGKSDLERRDFGNKDTVGEMAVSKTVEDVGIWCLWVAGAGAFYQLH